MACAWRLTMRLSRWRARTPYPGSTDLAFTEDVLKRMEAYGFHTQYVPDGTCAVAAPAPGSLLYSSTPTSRPLIRWQPLRGSSGDHDLAAIEAAIAEAKKVKDKPSFIKIR